MRVQNIKMPDIGEGIAEVELVAWRVTVGDTVHEDQILADVMTDKATVEIPSHVSGRVLSLDASVGQVVAVGAPIIHIETQDSEQNQAVAPIEQALTATEIKASTDPDAAPAAALAQAAPPPATGPSTAPAGPAPAPKQSAATPGTLPAASGTLAAPAVRQRARALGLDLVTLAGSGANGQVTHADLDAALRQQPTSAARTRADDDSVESLPVIGLRRKIAQKMQEAKRRIPHFTYVEEVDVTELEALRAQLNLQYAGTRGKLTLLPLLIRALVLAVREHPQVNARYDDDAAVLTRYAAVHLGLATQTDGGLMVPVMRDVQRLDLWACAREISRLADAARRGKASREELAGSTITLTSLGPLAGVAHTPVINHPEVAIVGPNRIMERLVLQQGLVVPRKLMNISSSFDHRVVDGMDAAQFIQCLRGYLECPALLFAP